MGVRIRYEFTSEFEGVEWRCDIHDSDYAAAINEAHGNGFNITYNGNGDKPLANIKGSSCQLNLLWRDNDAFYTGFINDLKAANEHEFALVIYKDSNLYWVGNITGDSLMWNNENTTRELTINAIDGLGRLRDMNYDDILPSGGASFSDTKQVFEVILDLLSLNNLDQFWGASDAYIEFEPHWAINTSYYDWLDRLSIPRGIFIKDSETEANNQEPKSAYECLEIILSHLNMRLIHSDGRYWLQQVMGMSGANAARRYTYYKTSTPISSSPYRWWQSTATTVSRSATSGTDFDILAGGKFSYFEGLQRAELDVPDNYFRYDVAVGSVYATTELKPSTVPFTETTELGVLKGGTGTGKQLHIFLNIIPILKVGALTQLFNNYYLRVRVKVIAGSYRLWDGGSSTNLTNLQWTTGTASHSVFIDRFKNGYFASQDNLISILTPEIPFASETVTVEITYDVLDKSGSSYSPSPVTLEFRIKELAFEYRDEFGVKSRSKLAINNPDITDYENNTLYKHPDYLLDDIGIVTNQNAFQLNTTTTTFVDVTSVDSGHSTDELISETILQDAMALQIAPIQVYEGAIAGIYEPYKTMLYDSNYYVFNGGSFDAKFDEWNCQWWQSSPEVGTIGNPARDNGRGYEYEGDDTYGAVRRVPTPWDHYGDVKDVVYGETIGGSGGTFGDTITTLPINSATESLLKSGDVVIIYNPDTLENLQEVTLTSDIDASDTSMSFSSVTLGNNIPPNAKIIRKGSDGFSSPSIRTDDLEVSNLILTPAQVTPTSSDFVLILDNSDSDKIKKVPYPVAEFATYKYYATLYSVSISAANTPVDLNLGTPTTSSIGTNFSYNSSTGELTYNGNRGVIRVSASAEIYPDGTGTKHIGFYLRHSSDGDVILPIRKYVAAGSETGKQVFNFSGLFDMQSGETVKLRCINYTDAEDLNFQYVQVFANSV